MNLKNYDGKKYYNGTNIWASGCPWIIVLSERANGKSLWYVKQCIIDFLKNGNKLAYVRRLDSDIRPTQVNRYFSDPNLISWLNDIGYSGAKCERGEIWLTRVDGDKEIKTDLIGYPFAISVQNRYKSLHYDCYNVIFEEFITNSSYLDNEFMAFNNIISTVARSGKFRAILLGNTISRDCPYLLELGIDLNKCKSGTVYRNELKQESGDSVSSIFDFAEKKEKSTFFFGKSERNIVSGIFETQEQPHLFFKFENKDVLYSAIMINALKHAYMLKVVLHDFKKYLYVYPCDYDKAEYTTLDVFTDFPDFKKNHFVFAEKKRHKKILKLIQDKRVMFSDNLTGTEFFKSLKNYNPFLS